MNILETIKNLWNALFHRKEILSALNLDEGALESNPMLDYTVIWKRLYSGTEFFDVKDPKIAATVCHEAARLVVSEMEVSVGEGPRATHIQELLDSQILNRAEELTEYTCALGGLILKPRFDGIKLVADVITQDQFFPTQFDSSGIQGGIFIQQRRKGKFVYTRLESWNCKGNGTYEVANRVYRSNAGWSDLGEPCGLNVYADWSQIAPDVTITGAPVPMFAYFRMPGANYIDLNNPMGVSLLGKAVDSIKAATTAYNALDWEVEGGELKRYRDISTFTTFDKEGNPVPDSKREKEYIFNGASGEGGGASLFETFSPTLRVSDHILALNRHLNQIEAQCGFSQGTFSIDEKTGMATATQVISSDHKTYSTVNSIQKSFETALKQLIAIYDFYSTVYGLAPKGDIDPSFVWDDSIVSSPDDKRNRMQIFVSAGKFPMRRYLIDYEGYSEEDADKIMAELANENAGQGITFDDFGNQPPASAASAIADTTGKALNGAQVTSLIGVVKSVKAGEISTAAAIAVIISAFGMTEEQAKKLLAQDVI